MITWFVAQTQPLKEAIAEKNLLEQGYEVYLPRFKKIRRHARKIDEVLAPLFPRYIFIGLNANTTAWRSINGTRGISYLLTTTENKPAILPKRIIDLLKAQEIAAGTVPLSSLLHFVQGETIRIIEGPFKEYTGIFDGMADGQRVRLLLDFMGRETKVALPLHAVDVA